MLESLGFSSATFVITIVNIVILCVILRAILFKPVTKFMADRAKKIQSAIDQAEKDRAQARKLLAEYEGKLKDADASAEEIVRAARENAEREAARIIAGGKAAAEALTAAARRQLEAEQQAALAKFRAEAALLVMAASSKLLARELNSEDSRRYVNMLLDDPALRRAAPRKGNG
jgi:F-type H+-transporting ATPase subunit b